MKLLKNADVRGKRVIVRVDFNVPIKDGVIEDDNRIKMSLKTINYLVDHNAKVILMSHLGKIKDESDKENNSLYVVYERLKELLNTNVYFSHATRGEELESLINNLQESEVLLMENTRYEDADGQKESGCDEELSSYWANLGEMFVLDAFASCHRAHASTYGIGKYLPSYVGFLTESELNILSEILNNKNKTIILGGAKVEDKIGVVKNLINDSDKILIGGKMSFTFLKACGYDVGPNFVDETSIDEIKGLLSMHKDKIILPVDYITESGEKSIDNLNEEAFDIGPSTIELFKENLSNASLVVWNGPLGKFEDEKYEVGTKEILEHLNGRKIPTVIAGGDTGNAVNKYNLSFYYISTGGGATLEYLSGNHFETLDNMKEDF